MGLGKTLQTIAHVLIEKQHGRLDRPGDDRHADEPGRQLAARARAVRAVAARSASITAPIAQRGAPSSPAHDVVITTYPLVARDRDELAAIPLHLLVLDEAHAIKNARRAGRRGGARARRAPPRLPVGHADREPPRRAVVAVRLPDARACSAARDDFTHAASASRSRSSGDKRPARGAARARAAVHPAPHQGRGRARAAGQDPARARRRARPARSASSTRASASPRTPTSAATSASAGSPARRSRSSTRCSSCARCAAIRAWSSCDAARDVTGSAKLDVLLELLDAPARRRPPHPGVLAVRAHARPDQRGPARARHRPRHAHRQHAGSPEADRRVPDTAAPTCS